MLTVLHLSVPCNLHSLTCTLTIWQVLCGIEPVAESSQNAAQHLYWSLLGGGTKADNEPYSISAQHTCLLWC